MKIIKKIFLFCLISVSAAFNIPTINLHDYLNPVLSMTNLLVTKRLINGLDKIDYNPNITRKIIHISSAPLFISTWRLYNDYNPQFWAGTVPILSSIYLIKNKENLSNILSRTNKSNEIFKGPLIYSIVLSFITINYWTNNPLGIIAMTQLAIGDGFSDLIGRRIGKTKWIYNKNKSVEGSLAFLLSSFLGTNLILHYFKYVLDYSFHYNIVDILIISIVCSLVETTSVIDDNISVPLFAIMIGQLMKIN